MENVKSFLSRYDEEWNKAEAPEINYENLPDDRYVINIETARIDDENPEKPLLKFGFRVLKGNYSRRLIFKSYRLDKPERFGYLKADLSKIGFELKLISELPDLLPSLVNRILEVNLKTGKPNQEGKVFQNCYIGSFVGMMSTGAEQDGINLDDLPF